jgi:hypothetical protein
MGHVGIVRTVEWKLSLPPNEATERLGGVLEKLDIDPEGDGGSIRARSARSLRKNRWAAAFDAQVEPFEAGSLVTCRVDMVGTKHFALLDEIADALGADAFDDRGIPQAVERIGKAARIFGRKEIRHLHHLLHGSERVVSLGQGTYEKKQGILVLTNERLFFFEKSLGSETIEEFPLRSISSVEGGKRLTGERLVIHASGNRAEITNMFHGHADEITRQIRALEREKTSAASTPAQPDADPLAQIERLAELRDRGLISEDEFQEKKTELLGRL